MDSGWTPDGLQKDSIRSPTVPVAQCKVLIFEINSKNIKLSKTLKFEQEGETVVLDVRGLIYHGDFHFTSRIIGTNGNIWYHDGMTTRSSCENERDFDKFSSRNLLKCRGKKLILVVYARV
jgi:hypothetical protein